MKTRRIKWKKRRWLKRFRTSTNGEEVDEGCGGGAQGPKLAGEKPKTGQQLAAARELAVGCSQRGRREKRVVLRLPLVVEKKNNVARCWWWSWWRGCWFFKP